MLRQGSDERFDSDGIQRAVVPIATGEEMHAERR